MWQTGTWRTDYGKLAYGKTTSYCVYENYQLFNFDIVGATKERGRKSAIISKILAIS